MKAEERHRLKTNELAESLQHLPEYLRKHGSKILTWVIVGLIVVVSVSWYFRSRKGSRLLGQCRMELLRKPRKPHWLLSGYPDFNPRNRPLWEKFVDEAYWNVALREE